MKQYSIVDLRTIKPVQMAYSYYEEPWYDFIECTVKVRTRKDWDKWLRRYNARPLSEPWGIVGINEFIPSPCQDIEF